MVGCRNSARLCIGVPSQQVPIIPVARPSAPGDVLPIACFQRNADVGVRSAPGVRLLRLRLETRGYRRYRLWPASAASLRAWYATRHLVIRVWSECGDGAAYPIGDVMIKMAPRPPTRSQAVVAGMRTRMHSDFCYRFVMNGFRIAVRIVLLKAKAHAPSARLYRPQQSPGQS
jgi:hypothetical protein